MTRRDCLSRIVRSLPFIGAAPIIASRGLPIFERIDRFGLPVSAWRAIERFGGVKFSRYAEETSRSTGYLGWIENQHGVVVGWVDRAGGVYRNVWTIAGRGYNVARDAGIKMIRVYQIAASDFTP